MLLKRLNELTYEAGKATRIDHALILANDEAFTEKNGARSDVKKVIVIFKGSSWKWTFTLIRGLWNGIGKMLNITFASNTIIFVGKNLIMCWHAMLSKIKT